MLKLKADKLVVLGFTDDELAQLVAGRPLLVDTRELGMPFKMAILHGRTEAAIATDLVGLGLKLPHFDADAYDRTGKATLLGSQDRDSIALVMLRLLKRAQGFERIPVSACCHCGAPANAAVGVVPAARNTPNQVGDWAICDACGGVNRLDDEKKLRKATAEELAALSPTERQILDIASDAVRSSRMRPPDAERGQA